MQAYRCAAQFCEECGTLLEASDSYCYYCHCPVRIEEKESHTTKEFAGKKQWSKEAASIERAMVKQRCPNCNAQKMYYTTRQMRSADEGQTVFYECPKCAYKFSVNT
mmetsp:Transcript_276/g.317  ORF Transcript_276/g.317 Transcript_276/m.317 type:complete len:107 (+) Transcript_276:1581-1901(+)